MTIALTLLCGLICYLLVKNSHNISNIKELDRNLLKLQERVNGIEQRSCNKAKAKRAESGTVRIINPTGKNTGRKK